MVNNPVSLILPVYDIQYVFRLNYTQFAVADIFSSVFLCSASDMYIRDSPMCQFPLTINKREIP